MANSQEVTVRKASLVQELEAASRKAYGNAKAAYLWSQGLFILALCCSVVAAISGIVFNVSGKIVGAIAALPPLLAFVAMNLKLEARSSWHYRKSFAMGALRSRLLYQLPEEPSVENIAAIAKSRDDLNSAMQTEWERTITISWGEMLKQRPAPTSQSSESLRPPQKSKV